jgi:ribosomal protein S18 acetylase RimI-like enzyme
MEGVMGQPGQLRRLSGLSGTAKAEVERLLRLCNEHEALDLPISPNDLIAPTNLTTAVLYSGNGPLIGFAAIPDDPVPEACVMVDPDYRRRGIGRMLIGEVRAECSRRGLAGCLLVTDTASRSAEPFLAALDIPYRSSEFRLDLDRTADVPERPRIKSFTMRPATSEDRETLVHVLAAAFGESAEIAGVTVDSGLQEKSRHFYIAELDREPIGALRAGDWDGFGDITAFGVLPEHQGKGYGRQMLLASVDLLTAKGFAQIRIEVETENSGALGLYESCGFRVQREYGYYRLGAVA